jgi:hypothetical protein
MAKINQLKMLPRHTSALPERAVESRRRRIADEKAGTVAQITNRLETSGGMIDRGAVLGAVAETGDCLEKSDAAGKQLKTTNWVRTVIGKEKNQMLWQVTTMKPPPVAEHGLETIDAKAVRALVEEEKTTTDRHHQLHDGVVKDILTSTIDRGKATESVVSTILPAQEGAAMTRRPCLPTGKRKTGASQGNLGVALL